MMKFFFFIILFYCCTFFQSSAQRIIIDSSKTLIKSDTSKHSVFHLNKNDSLRMVFKPNPKRAAIYSAILPGAGQFYNKKYWKVPLVLVAAGTVAYFITLNYQGYNSVRKGIARLESGDSTQYNQPIYVRDFNLKKYDLNGESVSDLLSVKKYFRQNLDVSILSGLVVYLLNIVDAEVDAHLFGFNMNDTLSFSPIYNQKGIGIAMNWR
jgi:TM2 domain-containing membrane protein YozV